MNEMSIDCERIKLIAGFYDGEGTHVWGGGTSYIGIYNSRFLTLEMVVSLGDIEAKITVEDAIRHKELPVKIVNEADNQKRLYIDIFSSECLIEISVNRTIVPCFCSSEINHDYRTLGICFWGLKVIKNDLWKIWDEAVVDKRHTCFLVDNYYRNYIHDCDYLFLELFKDIVIPGCFLDIGANIGQSACSICNVHPTVKVRSYEPNVMLEKNLEIVKRMLNGRMDYYLSGVGEEYNQKTFYVPFIEDCFFTQEGSFVIEEVNSKDSLKRISDSIGVDVQDIKIKQIMLYTAPIASNEIESFFVKIDVQGYELSTLNGIRTIINKYRPIILLEKGANVDEVLRILQDYKVYYYDPKKKGFTEKESNTANYFCIHKEYTNCPAINEKIRFV